MGGFIERHSFIIRRLAIAWSDATDDTDDTVDCITQLHTLIPGPAALLYYSWGVKQ